MKRVIALAAALLAACSPPSGDAAIVLYDRAFELEVVLDHAHGVTSPDGLRWHEGHLYIADEGGSAIRRWDGETLATLADSTSGIASPEDLVIDSDGRVWFTDDTAGGLWRVVPGGAERMVASTVLPESEGIALNGGGSLWVGDGKTGRVYAYDLRNDRIEPVAASWQVAKPESMAQATDGRLWLADNRENRLLAIAPHGSAREWPIPDDLSPESIATGAGTLWLTDSHNGRLYRLGEDGKPQVVALFLAEFANINGIALDDAGSVYLSVQSDLAAGKGFILRLTPTNSPPAVARVQPSR